MVGPDEAHSHIQRQCQLKRLADMWISVNTRSENNRGDKIIVHRQQRAADALARPDRERCGYAQPLHSLQLLQAGDGSTHLLCGAADI